jgi:hypothetical protein
MASSASGRSITNRSTNTNCTSRSSHVCRAPYLRTSIERQLLDGLQKAVLDPIAVEYAIEAFGVELEKNLAATTDSIEIKRRRKDEIDVELARLAEAVAIQGASATLLKAISAREAERKAIEEALWGTGKDSIQVVLSEIRESAMKQLTDIRTVLDGQVAAARVELSKHVDQIVMRPITAGDKTHYLAEGGWNLLGKYEGRPGAALRNLEMVAGARNAPKTPLPGPPLSI